MKKIMIIILLLVGLGSCDKVDQTNVTNVDYSIVLEARDRFENDTTANVAIIEKGTYNYVFERGKDYPVLESFTKYNTIILIVLLFGMLFGSLCGVFFLDFIY